MFEFLFRTEQEKALLRYRFPFKFRALVFLGAVNFRAGEKKLNSGEIVHDVKYYFEKTNILFLIGATIVFLFYALIPVIGIFVFILIASQWPVGERKAIRLIIKMGRKSNRKRMLREAKKLGLFNATELPFGFGFGEDDDLDLGDIILIKDYSKKSKKNKKIPRYMRERATAAYYRELYDDMYNYDYDSRSSPAHVVTCGPEAPKEEEGEMFDDIPEDEERIFNLRESLNNGHLKSVERFFKKKCNIYATDFGYGMERVSRDRTKVFEDINPEFIKIWITAETEKKEDTLKSMIDDYEKGEIQLAIRLTLTEILEMEHKSQVIIPTEKADCLDKYYRYSIIPEDLKILPIERK